MTVQELIDELSQCDPGMKVTIQRDFSGHYDDVEDIDHERVLCTMSSEFDYSVVVIR